MDDKHRIIQQIEKLKFANRYLNRPYVMDQVQIRRYKDEIQRLKKHLFLRIIKRFLDRMCQFVRRSCNRKRDNHNLK